MMSPSWPSPRPTRCGASAFVRLDDDGIQSGGPPSNLDAHGMPPRLAVPVKPCPNRAIVVFPPRGLVPCSPIFLLPVGMHCLPFPLPCRISQAVLSPFSGPFPFFLPYFMKQTHDCPQTKTWNISLAAPSRGCRLLDKLLATNTAVPLRLYTNTSWLRYSCSLSHDGFPLQGAEYLPSHSPVPHLVSGDAPSRRREKFSHSVIRFCSP
jgi:hypothetical protein